MLYEFKQAEKHNNNNTTTLCCIVENPRIENGFNTAEMVGVVEGFIDDTGQLYYRECEPKRFIFGGNFTLTEFNRELISKDAPKAKTRRL
jgi:hypothetical protein